MAPAATKAAEQPAAAAAGGATAAAAKAAADELAEKVRERVLPSPWAWTRPTLTPRAPYAAPPAATPA